MWFISSLGWLMGRICLIEIRNRHVRCKLSYFCLFFPSWTNFTCRQQIWILWLFVIGSLVDGHDVFEIFLLSSWCLWANFYFASEVVFYVFTRKINRLIELVSIELSTFNSFKLIFLNLLSSRFMRSLMNIVFDRGSEFKCTWCKLCSFLC